MIDHTPPQLARRLPLPPQLTRRVGVLGVLGFALFGIITFRLWYLQVLTGPQNVAVATANVSRSIPVQAPRGAILDSGGGVLADTEVGAEATITADNLPAANTKARWHLYVRLGRLLHLRPTDIWQVVSGPHGDGKPAWPGYQPSPIAGNLTTYQWLTIKLHPSEFPGVSVQEVNLRQYPHGGYGAVVLGQIGPISPGEVGTAQFKGIAPGTYVGQAGLEAQYNSILQGTPGVDKVQVDAAGYPTGRSTVTPPTPGDELQTSLSYGLEREGYLALERGIRQANHNHDPATSGAFFAMNPDTGRVLALGSVPTYNPSMFVTPPSQSQYTSVLDTGAFNDLATNGLFPTGSTFKPITALAGLKKGVITAQTLQGAGSCATISTETLCNSGRNDYGDVDLVTALQESVDTYFYKLGAELNCDGCRQQGIQDEARALGLGRSPGIDLPTGGAPGLVPDAQVMNAQNTSIIAADCDGHHPWPKLRGQPGYATLVTACAQGYYYNAWTIGQNVGLATGQGYLEATPMQMAVAYSAIVNDGTVWQPQLAERVLSPSGSPVQGLPAPTGHHISINAYDRSLVMEGLHEAAQTAPGTSCAIFCNFPMTVYGKTGTAVHDQQPDQSWYVCYVPDGAKSIVIAVTIPQGGFGAAAAAPVARLMLSEWFGLPEKWQPGSSPDR